MIATRQEKYCIVIMWQCRIDLLVYVTDHFRYLLRVEERHVLSQQWKGVQVILLA